MRNAWMLALAGCGGGYAMGPYIDPCSTTVNVLAPDQPSTLGFSGDEAVAWFGDTASVHVTWGGRHSQYPRTDTLVVALGAIDGDVQESLRAGVDPADDASCAAESTVSFARVATFATADGEVSGAGLMRFTLPQLELATASISGEAADVVIAAPRQAEVDRETAEAGVAPPDSMGLYLGHQPTFDYATIAADGPNYVMKVWNCDEQISPGCADWR
jgi:hypothetical protein